MSLELMFCEKVGQVLHFLDFFFLIWLEPGLELEQDREEMIISPKKIILIICLFLVFIVRHLTYHTLQPFQVFLLQTVQPFSYLSLLYLEVVFLI